MPNAPHDNVDATGYEILRDGKPLANGGAVTTYADTTALPNRTYTYTVRARDAAGTFRPRFGARGDDPGSPSPRAISDSYGICLGAGLVSSRLLGDIAFPPVSTRGGAAYWLEPALSESETAYRSRMNPPGIIATALAIEDLQARRSRWDEPCAMLPLSATVARRAAWTYLLKVLYFLGGGRCAGPAGGGTTYCLTAGKVLEPRR
jgi:hypothetical protein